MHPRHGGNIKNWYKLYTSIHYNLSHRQMQDGRRGNSANRGKTVFMASSFIWPIRGGAGGRCRSQPFATKERYGCGFAACRYTPALEEVSDSPKIPVKTVYFAGGQSRPPLQDAGVRKVSVGADAHIGPLGSFEFAADFRENGAICVGRCDARRLVSRRSRALRGS